MDVATTPDVIESPNRYSFVKKLGIFIFAVFLSEFVLWDYFLNFINTLNQNGTLNMGSSFSPVQIFWGDGIWMNIFRLTIAIVFAGVCGLIYGYLRRDETRSEKIWVAAANTIISIFGLLIAIMLMGAILGKLSLSDVQSSFSAISATIFGSAFYVTFLFLNIVCIFSATFFMIDVGNEAISETPYAIDRKDASTLLGIKWYHYLWLWLTIGIYEQFILSFLSGILGIIINFFRTVRWFNFFGVYTSGSANPISISYWGIVIDIILIYCTTLLLEYLRKILSGEKPMKIGMKILASVGIGIILPIAIWLLLAWFASR